jgi:hypothetical protein
MAGKTAGILSEGTPFGAISGYTIPADGGNGSRHFFLRSTLTTEAGVCYNTAT